jgi:hypothetical protein
VWDRTCKSSTPSLLSDTNLMSKQCKKLTTQRLQYVSANSVHTNFLVWPKVGAYNLQVISLKSWLNAFSLVHKSCLCLKSAAWNKQRSQCSVSVLLFCLTQASYWRDTWLWRYKQKLATNTDIIVELLCPCDKPIDLLSAIKGLKYLHQINSSFRSTISI